MNARLGRITFAADKVKEVVGRVESDVVPLYEQSKGFKGFTLLLDRASGQGIGISFWETEEDMLATDDLGEQARRTAAEAGDGQDQGTAHFDVAIDRLT